MRIGFWSIVGGWQDDDLIHLGERMEAARDWLRRNGGSACAEAEELGTFDLMFRKQITLTVHAGAFEPFVSSDLDDDEILKTVLDELESSKGRD
jgi:hypothetical protein